MKDAKTEVIVFWIIVVVVVAAWNWLSNKSVIAKWAIRLVVGSFLLFAVHGYLTTDRDHLRTITSIEESSRSTRIELNDGRVFQVDLDQPKYNRRNLLLLFNGKHVWVLEGKPCWDMTPVKQDDPPKLDRVAYTNLVKAGFTDSEILYSYSIPVGIPNPNPEPSNEGGYVSYGPPEICANPIKTDVRR